MVDSIAAKIGALLLKAEATDNEHEADAYMAAAQRLSTQYQIDMEVARLAHGSRQAPPTPVIRRIVIGEAGKRGLFTYVKLFSSIARPNGVKVDIAQNSTYVIAYGFDTDVDTVEMLYNSLLTQMVTASAAYIRSGQFREEKIEGWVIEKHWSEWSGRWVKQPVWGVKKITALTARLSFQEAFARRIGQRLIEAKREAVEQAPVQASGQSAELVLVGREVAVAEHYKANSRARGSYKGGAGRQNQSSYARSAGDNAGRSARIHTTTAIGGQRKAVSA